MNIIYNITPKPKTMFEMTSIRVSATQTIRVEAASNADYVWLYKGDKPYVVIVVPHDQNKKPHIYRCPEGTRAYIMQLHGSYPVRLSDVRSYLASIRHELCGLPEERLKQAVIAEIDAAFPEFDSEKEVECFVEENWAWLQSFVAAE